VTSPILFGTMLAPVVEKVCAVCDQPCHFFLGSIYGEEGEDNQCNACFDAEIEQADPAYLGALATDYPHPVGNVGAREAYLKGKAKGKGKGKDKDKDKGKDKGAGGKDKGSRSRSRSPEQLSHAWSRSPEQ
jgi:hypothetical protein